MNDDGSAPALSPQAVFPAGVARWAALRTSAHWEKQLASALTDCGIPVFLPLMTRVTTYQSKRRTTEVPIFSGYVFCSEADFIGNRAIPQAYRKRVAQVLRPANYDQLRSELAEIGELLRDRKLIQEHLRGKPGDAVRITGGPLKGTEGVIRRLDPARQRILLEITFLGVRLEVNVEDWFVEKLT